MNRLPDELQRLYPRSDPSAEPSALVLGVSGPSAWQSLVAVWKGVQSDLGLPAPAITVNGRNGLQLWFSLQQPVGSGPGQAFLDGLCRRYLADLPASRISTVAAPVPALQPDTGVWSAFIAPDLAPVFEDTPWLDSQPGDDGQAGLLARLQRMPLAAFEAALAALVGASAAPGPVASEAAPARPKGDPPADAARQFLLGVMNDGNAPLALRIEAAKALLLPQQPAG
ncbi:MAG: hypothetical protein IV093_20015 [Rubrivivax sp.]|nr:hypothetical protein [Rubrivivax sp.]